MKGMLPIGCGRRRKARQWAEFIFDTMTGSPGAKYPGQRDGWVPEHPWRFYGERGAQQQPCRGTAFSVFFAVIREKVTEPDDLSAVPQRGLFPIASRRNPGFPKQPEWSETMALPHLRSSFLCLEGGDPFSGIRALSALREFRSGTHFA